MSVIAVSPMAIPMRSRRTSGASADPGDAGWNRTIVKPDAEIMNSEPVVDKTARLVAGGFAKSYASAATADTTGVPASSATPLRCPQRQAGR